MSRVQTPSLSFLTWRKDINTQYFYIVYVNTTYACLSLLVGERSLAQTTNWALRTVILAPGSLLFAVIFSQGGRIVYLMLREVFLHEVNSSTQPG